MKTLLGLLLIGLSALLAAAGALAQPYYSYGYSYGAGGYPAYNFRYYNSYGPSGWGYSPTSSYYYPYNSYYRNYYPSNNYPSSYNSPSYYYRGYGVPYYYNYWPYTYRVYYS